MLFLAGAAGLFLDGAMVRFIPRAGKATPRLIGLAYLISALAAVLVASVFLIGIKLWAPALAFLTEDPWLTGGFILGTVVIVIFAEEDWRADRVTSGHLGAIRKLDLFRAKNCRVDRAGADAAPIWHPGLLDRTRPFPLIVAVNLLIFMPPGASPHPKNRPKRRAAGGGPDYPLHCR